MKKWSNNYILQRAYFGLTMDPKASVKVDVIGQWAELKRVFNANVYEYFGYGIRRLFKEVQNCAASYLLIDTSEAVYGAPESSYLAAITVHGNSNKSANLVTVEHSSTPEAVEEAGEWEGEDFSSAGDHPYPNFYCWAVAGAIVVGIALLGSVCGMVRYWSQDSADNAKKHYKFSTVKVLDIE